MKKVEANGGDALRTTGQMDKLGTGTAVQFHSLVLFRKVDSALHSDVPSP
jgi:hypothetical protein